MLEKVQLLSCPTMPTIGRREHAREEPQACASRTAALPWLEAPCMLEHVQN